MYHSHSITEQTFFFRRTLPLKQFFELEVALISGRTVAEAESISRKTWVYNIAEYGAESIAESDLTIIVVICSQLRAPQEHFLQCISSFD